MYQTTVTPQTTSTDAWVTTANQTVTAVHARRIGLNDWIRDGAPFDTATGLAVAVGATGSTIVRAGTRAHPLKGFFEIADIVETSRNSGIWKAGWTTDGLHPNATGYAAAYLGIDLSVFII